MYDYYVSREQRLIDQGNMTTKELYNLAWFYFRKAFQALTNGYIEDYRKYYDLFGDIPYYRLPNQSDLYENRIAMKIVFHVRSTYHLTHF